MERVAAKRRAKEKSAKGKGKAKQQQLLAASETESEDDEDEVAQVVASKPARTSKFLKAAKVAKTSATATPTSQAVVDDGTSKPKSTKVLKMTLASNKAKGKR